MSRPNRPVGQRILGFLRKQAAVAARPESDRGDPPSTVSSVRLKSRDGIEGFIDMFGPDRISGWVQRSRPTAEALTIAFYDGEQYLCSVTADLDRPDVARTAKLSSRCGFELSMPPTLREAGVHEIDVRIGGTSVTLLSKPIRIKTERAPALAKAQKAEEIVTDTPGAEAAQAPAGGLAVGDDEGPKPLVASEPTASSNDQAGSGTAISAATPASSAPLADSAPERPPEPPSSVDPPLAETKPETPERSFVAKVSGTTISGIAVDPASPDKPAEIEFFANGNLLDRATANLARSVIDGASASTRCGFRHTLDLDFSRLKEFTISVRLRGGAEIDNSPFLVSEESTWNQGDRDLVVLLGTRVGYGPTPAKRSADPAWKSAAGAISVFVQLLAYDAVSSFTVAGERAQPGVDGLPPTPTLMFDTLPLSIEDVWFLNEADLRVRCESGAADSESKPVRLLLYQVDPDEAALIECGSTVLNGGPTILSARLLNPLLPVLIIVLAADNSLVGATLLPFPSLCRGGLHQTELRSIGEGPSHMVSLRRLSDALLEEYLGRSPDDQPFAIAELRVDMRGATGAERIFSSFVKSWISGFLGIDLVPTQLDDLSYAKVRQHLEAALRSDSPSPRGQHERSSRRRSNENLILTIPADAIPSISTVVSRRARLPGESSVVVGSFLVADSDSGSAGYSVSMPPIDSFLLTLQPAHAPLCFPFLTRSDQPSSPPSSRSMLPPLAIRFHGLAIRDESQLVYPVATNGRVLAASTQGNTEEPKISVLVAPKGNAEATLPLLRSLASQTFSKSIEVVVAVSPDGGEASAAQAMLADLFADRHRIVQHPGAPSARLNFAARNATGSYFLLAAESMVLHDPRTLETLYTLAREEAVASSSCMLLRETFSKKGSLVTFHSCGLFPTHLSVASAPNVIFKELEVTAAFPLATYPVAGNSFRLALIRADVWAKLGGLDEATFPVFQYDLDFSLRALEAGYLHLSTSAISATDLAAASTAEQIDVLALSHLRPDRWQEILSRSAIIRDLR